MSTATKFDLAARSQKLATSYDLLINNIGLKTQNIIETITDFYNNGITDEFIEPVVITDNNNNIEY